MLKDFYTILQIPDNTKGNKIIKKAVNKAFRKYHPDFNENGDKQNFLNVIEAKNILLDPTKRKIYNFANWLYKNTFSDLLLLSKNDKLIYSPKGYFKRTENGFKSTEKKTVYLKFIEFIYNSAIKLSKQGKSQNECMKYMRDMLSDWNKFSNFCRIYSDRAIRNSNLKHIYLKQINSPMINEINKHEPLNYTRFFKSITEPSKIVINENNDEIKSICHRM